MMTRRSRATSLVTKGGEGVERLAADTAEPHFATAALAASTLIASRRSIQRQLVMKSPMKRLTRCHRYSRKPGMYSYLREAYLSDWLSALWKTFHQCTGLAVMDAPLPQTSCKLEARKKMPSNADVCMRNSVGSRPTINSKSYVTLKPLTRPLHGCWSALFRGTAQAARKGAKPEVLNVNGGRGG
jgi:hypothetical protein